MKRPCACAMQYGKTVTCFQLTNRVTFYKSLQSSTELNLNLLGVTHFSWTLVQYYGSVWSEVRWTWIWTLLVKPAICHHQDISTTNIAVVEILVNHSLFFKIILRGVLIKWRLSKNLTIDIDVDIYIDIFNTLITLQSFEINLNTQ